MGYKLNVPPWLCLSRSLVGEFMSDRQPESEPEATADLEEEGLVNQIERLSLTAASSSSAVVPVESPRSSVLDTFPALEALQSASVIVERRNSNDIVITRRLNGSILVSSEPRRIYIVWGIPGYSGSWDLSGVHISAGTVGYGALLTLNGGYQGLRFRRVDTIIQARREFQNEAARHSVHRDRAFHQFFWE